MSDRSSSRLDTIDLIKAVALIWIFLNHAAEAIWGFPFIGNPDHHWAPLVERIDQLVPMNGSGFTGFGANLFRYVGWFGDQAVGWFILLSGFTLSISQLRRSASTDSLSGFYQRRFRRIFPTWWAVHLIILLPVALLGWRITIADPRFFLSFMGVRVTPDQMYFGIPAWWFIGLLLQLYLCFPFLHRMMRRFGPGLTAAFLILISLAARAWGMQSMPEWVDAWNRGSIFLSRLAEFASGMWLAFAMDRSAATTHKWLRAPGSQLLAIVVLVFATAASIRFWGVVPAPWLTAVSGVTLAFAFFHSRAWSLAAPILGVPLRWIADHSLTLFLVHHPIVWILLRHEASTHLNARMLVRLAGSVVITIVLTLIVDAFADWLLRMIERGIQRWSGVGLAIRCGAVLAAIVLLVLPLEMAVRKHNPQDITDFGWSERPSLVPDEQLGFRLKPSSITRLRWESYDYTVTANAAGFPGPELPVDKRDNVFRIVTLGDAFTSAEGVDTAKAWPRLLQTKLNASPRKDLEIEVVNFGITGFGPNQYATLVQTQVPQLKPDLIIIGFFTNDYVDVQCSAEDFQEMIGFDKPNADTWLALLTGRHLCRYLRGAVAENLVERITGEPCSHTRFFCQSDLFDRNNEPYVAAGRDLVRDRFAEIARVADKYGAKVCVVSIPAPIQVMPLEQLKYVRPCLDLRNDERYDYGQPQRFTSELTAEIGFQHFDLRPALRASTGRQPYQPHNLHFTEAGHDVVSDALVQVVNDLH